jgi:hypothetical protein
VNPWDDVNKWDMGELWDVVARCDGCGRVAVKKVTPVDAIRPGQSLGMGRKGSCPGCEWGTGIDVGTILAVAPVECLAVFDEKKGRR